MDSLVDLVHLWQSPISGIELFEAQLFQHRFGKHFHDTYTIGLNEGGRGQSIHKKAKCYHYPGCFNCINPGEAHTGSAIANDGWTFRNFYISQPAVRQILTQLGWPDQPLPCFSSLLVEDPSLRGTFHQLFQVLRQPTAQLEQDTLLLHFFSQLFSKHALSRPLPSDPQPEPKAIARVRTYLEAHCTEKISIDDLAKLANLNPYYLIRCFHQQVGLPPHRYKKHCQLLQAKKALQGEQSLGAIAIDYGFYDQSHFNRTFKRTFGLSPGRYRKDNFIQSKRYPVG